jgi:hypothetical protein
MCFFRLAALHLDYLPNERSECSERLRIFYGYSTRGRERDGTDDVRLIMSMSRTLARMSATVRCASSLCRSLIAT